MGEENEHPAVVSCTKSRALRTEVRKFWNPQRRTLSVYRRGLVTKSFRAMQYGNKNKNIVAAVAMLQYEEEINDNSYVSSSDMKDKQVQGQQGNAFAGNDTRPGGAMEVLRTGSGSATSGAWCPPSNGLVKLNTDASYLADSGQTCVGVVARDHRGLVLFSQSKRIERCSSVEEAEARALLLGLQSLAALFRGPIIAETDCSFIAKELQSEACNRSACFSVIYDVKNELSKFREVRVGYVNRIQNNLAHCLAARARGTEDTHKVAGVPDDVVEVMRADMVSAQE